jgi:hypothetical protein
MIDVRKMRQLAGKFVKILTEYEAKISETCVEVMTAKHKQLTTRTHRETFCRSSFSFDHFNVADRRVIKS